MLKVDSSPMHRAYVAFAVNLDDDDVQQVSLMLYSRTGRGPDIAFG